MGVTVPLQPSRTSTTHESAETPLPLCSPLCTPRPMTAKERRNKLTTPPNRRGDSWSSDDRAHVAKLGANMRYIDALSDSPSAKETRRDHPGVRERRHFAQYATNPPFGTVTE
jgi:hypothetical protein